MKEKENVIIAMPNGSVITIPNNEYEIIADFVRTRDQEQLAKDVLICFLSGNDKNLENLENYVVSDSIRLNDFIDELNSRFESNQGEKEYEAVQELAKRYEMAVYRITSNKGTNEEQIDEAVLPKELAEVLTSQSGLVIITTDGSRLDSTYIDDIEYVGVYD